MFMDKPLEIKTFDYFNAFIQIYAQICLVKYVDKSTLSGYLHGYQYIYKCFQKASFNIVQDKIFLCLILYFAKSILKK